MNTEIIFYAKIIPEFDSSLFKNKFFLEYKIKEKSEKRWFASKIQKKKLKCEHQSSEK